jgi:hypothetical protein
MDADSWTGGNYNFNRQEWHTETLTQLEYYESEYRILKESTSLLELAMWKTRIEYASMDDGNMMVGGKKKLKMDLSDFRLQCRISCGAKQVVENVFPYLLPPDFVRSYVYVETDDDDDDDEDSDEYDDGEEVYGDNEYIENVDDEEENEEH